MAPLGRLSSTAAGVTSLTSLLLQLPDLFDDPAHHLRGLHTMLNYGLRYMRVADQVLHVRGVPAARVFQEGLFIVFF